MSKFKIKNLKPKHKVAFSKKEATFLLELEKKRKQEKQYRDYIDYLTDEEIFKELI
jgi:uncharacterized protein YkuJ